MWLNTLRKRWLGQTRLDSARLARARISRQRLLIRPRLEALEERTLLTAYSAASIGDLVTDIGLANQNGGTNTITLSAPTGTTYTLTGALPTIANTGSGTKSEKLTILGDGNILDGNNQYRLFDVAGGNSLTLENLTLQHGLAKGAGKAAEGGAVFSSGTLTLSGVNVLNNEAEGTSGTGGGGAIPNEASGGGLYVAKGTVILSSDVLKGNIAQGGTGAAGHTGSRSESGDHGGAGGTASGGGLFVAGSLVTVTLRNDVLSDNSAKAGNGGQGGPGGPGSQAYHTGPGGHGGGGGDAYGGGLYVGAPNVGIPNGDTITLSNDTLSGNTAQGGNGGPGGPAGLDSLLSPPGPVGKGGSADGGGVYVAAGLLAVTLSNDALLSNAARGGTGGTGVNGAVGGAASGGGLYILGSAVNLISDTVADNTAAGNSGGSGAGGGLNIDGGAANPSGATINLTNTLIAGNTATGGTPVGPDVYGTVTSSDHDLIANTAGSSGFGQANSGDKVNVAAAINSNGTLQAGSPAIDAGDTSAVNSATDRRGYAHLVGNGIDIGAFEYGAVKSQTDLALTGSVSSTVMNAGGQITYTLTLTNKGSTAQSDITLFDALPADTTLQPLTAVPGWYYAASAQTNSVFAWNNSNALAPGTSVTFTFVLQVNSGTPAGTVLKDTATVGPTTGDPKPGNNNIAFKTTVLAAAPVQVPASDIASYQTTGPSYVTSLGEWIEKVTITPTVAAGTLSGPLALVLTGLPAGVTLANANGIYEDDPFRNAVSATGSISNAAPVTVTLYFKAPQTASFNPGFELWQGL